MDSTVDIHMDILDWIPSALLWSISRFYSNRLDKICDYYCSKGILFLKVLCVHTYGCSGLNTESHRLVMNYFPDSYFLFNVLWLIGVAILEAGIKVLLLLFTFHSPFCYRNREGNWSIAIRSMSRACSIHSYVLNSFFFFIPLRWMYFSLSCQEKKLVAEIKRTAKTGNDVCSVLFTILISPGILNDHKLHCVIRSWFVFP